MPKLNWTNPQGIRTCLRINLFTLIILLTAFHADTVYAGEEKGACGNIKYILSYSYSPDRDEIGSPWKAVLRANGRQIKGFYIAGGDGFSFYTADNQTTLANRPRRAPDSAVFSVGA